MKKASQQRPLHNGDPNRPIIDAGVEARTSLGARRLGAQLGIDADRLYAIAAYATDDALYALMLEIGDQELARASGAPFEDVEAFLLDEIDQPPIALVQYLGFQTSEYVH